MDENVDRIAEITEHVQTSLRSLDRRKKVLARKKKGLEALGNHLTGLLDRAEKADGEDDLEEIIRIGELGVELRPDYPKLSKYLVIEGIKRKLAEVEAELDGIIRETEEIDRKKAEADLCPDCGGAGRLKNVEIVREEGTVHPVMHVTECTLCGGKGRIDFQPEL